MYNSYESKLQRNKKIGVEYNSEEESTIIWVSICIHKSEKDKYLSYRVIREIGDKCVVETSIGFNEETLTHILPIIILIKDINKTNDFLQNRDKAKGEFTIKIEI